MVGERGEAKDGVGVEETGKGSIERIKERTAKKGRD
jgi:hypothetical protein